MRLLRRRRNRKGGQDESESEGCDGIEVRERNKEVRLRLMVDREDLVMVENDRGKEKD